MKSEFGKLCEAFAYVCIGGPNYCCSHGVKISTVESEIVEHIYHATRITSRRDIKKNVIIIESNKRVPFGVQWVAVVFTFGQKLL